MDKKWNSSRKLTSKEDNPNIIEERVIVKSNTEVGGQKVSSTSDSKNSFRTLYSKGKQIGKGGFAKWYEFTNLDNKRIYAAKVIHKSNLTRSRAKQKLMSEIKIHRSLNHQYVANFEHFFEDSEWVYILLELCHNQTMNELLKRRKRLHEIEVQWWTLQIISALKYLHGHRVIHRDIKLGNLFISNKMEIKLGDFGLATKLDFDGEKKRTIWGTPNYIAPEVIEGKTGHSYEVDIWSLGVVIYTLLIGKPPFETSNVKKTYSRIKNNSYTFPDHVQISDAAKDLIKRILIKDPKKRPTLDEILSHEFLNPQYSIPKSLPSSLLVWPPSSSYLKQHNIMSSSTRASSMPFSGSEKHENFENYLNKFRTGKKETPATAKLKKSDCVAKMPIKENIPQNNGINLLNNVKIPVSSKPPEVWVKKWVDYSTKYGLGYMLSNNAYGVFFNDSTKIILEPSGLHFDYIERKISDKPELIHTHTLSDYPEDFHKKVTLLQHFKNYLETESKVNTPDVSSEKPESKEKVERKVSDIVYVKKWVRTKHAVMFRLSNKIVQVNFQDHTEIILSSETRMVTYVDKRGERKSYHLSQAVDWGNMEMSKRLKYTKDILTHMLSNNRNKLLFTF
jgi:polo-like kinase 1